MNSREILEQLLSLLESKNIEVRTDSLGGGAGGLCKIKGRYTFFVDSDSTTADSAVNAAQAVVKLLDIEAVYIKPEVREFIEKHSTQNGRE
jgi:hypothetical protein